MTRPIRVLELRSVRGTGGGPEKTILLGTARTDPARFAITVCYIRDDRDTVFGIDAKASALPVDYVELRERHSLDPSIWGALRRLVRERQIDIVHAHEYKTDFLAWLLGKAEPIIPLATAHGWTGHSPRERYAYYPLDKRMLASFPRVIAVSGQIRSELIAHGARPGRVVTVLNGIDHQQFRRDRTREQPMRAALGIAPEDVVIGSIGRLEPQKRFDLLLDAVATLRATHPRLRCRIAGDGSLNAALSNQITALGLSDVCTLLGHRDDVQALHHAFDLYVQSSDYEGTPNAVLEAMALETPVIATDVGGTAEMIVDGRDGRIVPPGDRAALAAAVGQALASPAVMRTWAASARSRVETDLSFATRMSKVEAVYTELFEARAGAKAGATLPARS
jgi:glycosyltransferase involved in cell wall biosynthesis